MSLFRGLSAFPLTPLTESGSLVTELFQRNLERLVTAGVSSIGLMGSTGSYAYMTPATRQKALRAAVEVVNGRVPLILSVGALRSDEACALARDGAQAGASGLLLAPVSYQRLTEGEVFALFAEVAGAGGLPLCIYNNPTTTGFTFSPALIARLAVLPQVGAVKMPLAAEGDFAGEIKALRGLCGPEFGIGYSGDWGAGAALLAGADAWYSVVAGLLPVEALRLQQAASVGDAGRTARMNRAFAPLWALFQAWGSYRVMYLISDLIDGSGLLPPAPVQLPPAGVREAVAEALTALREA